LRSISLRNRAILLATPVLVISLGLVGLAVKEANYRGAVSALQLRMESYVYTVLAAMEVDPVGELSMEEDFADPRLLQPESGLYVEVRGERGQWRSPSALGVALPAAQPVGSGEVTFSEPRTDMNFFALRFGIGWQLINDDIVPFTVSVFVDRAELEQQSRAFQAGLWRSLMLAGAILVLAQIVILLLIFRPLRKVALDVARVESGEADRLEGKYPSELDPLARNVNRLLETEKSNQQRIRNALDSLAHSLKTPLAVIQAGLPLHGGASEQSMQNAVDEMNRLIGTRLERAGGSARRAMATPVAVADQLQRVIASLQKVHSQKMIETELILDENLLFYGEERDLLELLGNLLDNAFKYGKSTVRVSARMLPGAGTRPGMSLCVEDDGSGIEDSQWSKLLQRGIRGDERVEGHGLGLSIVVELVTAYGGDIDIAHSDLGGAAITVTIPPGS
jgi:two-component system sensor histidine kinase PhoQ